MISSWALLCVACAVQASTVEVVTADGQRRSGELTELSAQQAILLVEGTNVTIPTGQLVEIKGSSASGLKLPATAAWVRLRDGSELQAADYRVEAGRATIPLTCGATLKLPTRSIHSVRFQEQAGRFAELWQEIATGTHDGDVIVVRKEDTLDFVAGSAGDVTDELVHFLLDGEKVPVKRPRVEGILYFSAAKDDFPAAFCTAVLHGGSRWEVTAARLAGADWVLTSRGGVELTCFPEQLARLQYNIQFLSDIEPELARCRPRFDVQNSPLRAAYEAFHRPRLNVGFDGGPLRLGQVNYDRGLALYGESEVIFRLPAGVKLLQGLLGIDDGARPRGEVRVQIFGDDRELFSAEVHGREGPRGLALDVSGVRRLRIVVSSGVDEIDDRLVLADARLLQ